LNLPSINESDIPFYDITFYFSEITKETFEQVLERLREKVIDEQKARYINMDYFKFIELMSQIKQRCNIKNHTVAFLKMIEICEDWLNAQKK